MPRPLLPSDFIPGVHPLVIFGIQPNGKDLSAKVRDTWLRLRACAWQDGGTPALHESVWLELISKSRSTFFDHISQLSRLDMFHTSRADVATLMFFDFGPGKLVWPPHLSENSDSLLTLLTLSDSVKKKERESSSRSLPQSVNAARFNPNTRTSESGNLDRRVQKLGRESENLDRSPKTRTSARRYLQYLEEPQ